MWWNEMRGCAAPLGSIALGITVLVLSLTSARAQSQAHAAPPAQDAPAVQSPGQLIAETIDQVFKLLRDPELKKTAKLRLLKLRGIVDRAFDWEAMAQSSLGPPWRKLDDKQRAEFVSVFKELLAQEYMDDIDRFQGNEEVQTKSSEKSGEVEIVNTVLITSSREQVPMNYTLQKEGKRWAVVDMSIEGVSLVNHYRQTFGRFLANKQFPELMQQLKRKLGIHE
ncbi:MAG TPA: ABC transporter substrate-binding protein [Polyangiales bacterium]